MFLLIRKDPSHDCKRGSGFTFQYVSINTNDTNCDWIVFDDFTFQYVSINTQKLVKLSDKYNSLHSNMFLLIQTEQSKKKNRLTLYIPICFY